MSMQEEDDELTNLSTENVLRAIDAVKGRSWDVNPFTVADELKVSRALIYRHAEAMKLIMAARGGGFGIDMQTSLDLAAHLRELEQQNNELKEKLAANPSQSFEAQLFEEKIPAVETQDVNNGTNVEEIIFNFAANEPYAGDYSQQLANMSWKDLETIYYFKVASIKEHAKNIFGDGAKFDATNGGEVAKNPAEPVAKVSTSYSSLSNLESNKQDRQNWISPFASLKSSKTKINQLQEPELQGFTLPNDENKQLVKEEILLEQNPPVENLFVTENIENNSEILSRIPTEAALVVPNQLALQIKANLKSETSPVAASIEEPSVLESSVLEPSLIEPSPIEPPPIEQLPIAQPRPESPVIDRAVWEQSVIESSVEANSVTEFEADPQWRLIPETILPDINTQSEFGVPAQLAEDVQVQGEEGSSANLLVTANDTVVEKVPEWIPLDELATSFTGSSDAGELVPLDMPIESVDEEGQNKDAAISGDELRNLIQSHIKNAADQMADIHSIGTGKEFEVWLNNPAKSKFVGSTKASETANNIDDAVANPAVPANPATFKPRIVPPDVRKSCLILGIRMDNITYENVQDAWKKAIAAPGVHPDQGGDTELAVYLNTAKDVLMRWLDAQAPKLGKKFGPYKSEKDVQVRKDHKKKD